MTFWEESSDEGEIGRPRRTAKERSWMREFQTGRRIRVRRVKPPSASTDEAGANGEESGDVGRDERRNERLELTLATERFS